MAVLAAHAIAQAQIRGENVEAARRPVTADGHVAHAMVAVIRPQDGLPVIERLPVETIAADGEVDLLAIGAGLFAEVDEEVVLHGGSPPLKNRIGASDSNPM